MTRQAEFNKDLGRGLSAEARILAGLRERGWKARSLGSDIEVRHLGDLELTGSPVGDIIIEVKADERSAKTGNLALELADFSPRKGVQATGIVKHVTQVEPVLFAHLIGPAEDAERLLVYEPLSALNWLKTNASSVPLSIHRNGVGAQGRTVAACPSIDELIEDSAFVRGSVKNFPSVFRGSPRTETLVSLALERQPLLFETAVRIAKGYLENSGRLFQTNEASLLDRIRSADWSSKRPRYEPPSS